MLKYHVGGLTMSGRIIQKSRNGRSRDPKYTSYPEWYWECHDEGDDKKFVTLSPTEREFEDLIVNSIIHEDTVDKIRIRTPQAEIKRDALVKRLQNLKF